MSTAVGSCQSRRVVSIWIFKTCFLCKLHTHSHKWSHVFFLIVFVLIPAAVAGTGAPGEEEEALPTYKDAFPPLPEKAASPEGTQETANAWTSKLRPLKASVITQVKHFSKLTLRASLVMSCHFRKVHSVICAVFPLGDRK